MRHQTIDKRARNKEQRERTLVFGLLLTSVFGLLTFSSCEHEDYSVAKPNENIRPAADFLKNNYDYKLYYAALEHTGLVEELNGEGPLTVLAFSDAAFNEVGIETVSDIQKLNPDSLRAVMQYHVLKDRRLRVADIPVNGVDVRYETLTGEQLYTTNLKAERWGSKEEYLYFDGVVATIRDIPLANGVMHVLKRMMKYHRGETVQDYLAKNPDHSIFVAMLQRFGLWDELAESGPFTIFAPLNSAFEQYNIDIEAVQNMDPARFYPRFLGIYIMYQKHYFIFDQYFFRIVNNEQFGYRYTLRDDPVTQFEISVNNGSYGSFTLALYRTDPFRSISLNKQFYNTMTINDNRCENGLVHAIDDLMLAPDDANAVKN